jgi:hypothetical protein
MSVVGCPKPLSIDILLARQSWHRFPISQNGTLLPNLTTNPKAAASMRPQTPQTNQNRVLDLSPKVLGSSKIGSVGNANFRVPSDRRMYTRFGKSFRCVSLLCLPIVEIGASNHQTLSRIKCHHDAHIPKVASQLLRMEAQWLQNSDPSGTSWRQRSQSMLRLLFVSFEATFCV